MNEDICQTIVQYGRTKIIGNEEQFLATVLSFATCYAPDDSQYICTIIIGESAGGKTKLQKTGVKLLNPKDVHILTSGSEKAPIYSPALREGNVKFIQLAELQKLPPAILEFMKGMSGDDGKFVYEVTDGAGKTTDRIEHTKKVYSVTYAQVDIDKELKTRVFIIPVDENVNINRCVAAIKFGAKEVEYRGRTYDVRENLELESKVVEAIHSISVSPMKVTIPYPFALIDMVNHSRTESKRHAQMITNLISSSCRLNWGSRKLENGALVANAQDMCNIMSLFDLLQATMMGIDLIDHMLYKRLGTHPKQSREQLVKYLQQLGLGELTKTELVRRLDKLYDENFIVKESSPTGFEYCANPHKQIVSLKVDWEMIRECDPSPVTCPISEVTYENIVSFGKAIENEHRIVEIPKESSDAPKISEREVKMRMAILDQLAGNSGEPMYALSLNAARNIEDKDIGVYDCMPIVEKLYEEGLINFDSNTKKYTEKYNEIGVEVEVIQV